MSLDAHMWLETADGKIVNDQDFSQYDYVKRVRKCSGEKKYKAYEGEKAKKTLAKVQQMIQTRMDMMISVSAYTSSPKTKKQFWEEYRKTPVAGCCFMNAIAMWKKNKHLKIKIGSMGWEKTDGSGVWWEYGDA